MNAAERYLRPEVIRQVARLDLRAKFIGLNNRRHGDCALRVCPKTSGGITKFSEHEAD